MIHAQNSLIIDSSHAECNEGIVKPCPVHGRIDKDQYDGDGCNKFCEVEVRLNWMLCLLRNCASSCFGSLFSSAKKPILVLSHAVLIR